MEEKPIKQAIRYIQRSQNILLVTHERMDGDGFGSGLALNKSLTKLGKKVSFISFDTVPDSLTFLPKSDIISDKVPIGNDFIISLDCTNVAVDKLKYNKIGDRVNILVNPKNGTFSEEDVSFRRGQSKYDLIIILDCGDISQLGKLYRNNIDLFYDTVVLNIDHHVSNDHFGKINLVDPAATSTAEIVLSLLDALQANVGEEVTLLDEDVATCLLTGITVDTNSFQNQNTSPKAFSISAQLLAAGARQQEIIKHIYKTHNLSTLKLWGKALSNLKYDKDAKIVWTILAMSDFEKVNASPDEIGGLMDELITSAPGSEIALLIREIEEGVYKGSIRTMHNAIDANRIAGFFKGGGHKRAAGFKIEGESIEKIENFIMKKLFDYQLDRLKGGNLNTAIDMEEDEIMKIPQDSETRSFVTKVREAASAHDNDDKKRADTTESKLKRIGQHIEEKDKSNKDAKEEKTNDGGSVFSVDRKVVENDQKDDEKKKEEEEISKLEKISESIEKKEKPKKDTKDEKRKDSVSKFAISRNAVGSDQKNGEKTEKTSETIENKDDKPKNNNTGFSINRNPVENEKDIEEKIEKPENSTEKKSDLTPDFSVSRHSSNISLNENKSEAQEVEKDLPKKDEEKLVQAEMPTQVSVDSSESLSEPIPVTPNITPSIVNKPEMNVPVVNQPGINIPVVNNPIHQEPKSETFISAQQENNNSVNNNATSGGFTPGIEFKLKEE